MTQIDSPIDWEEGIWSLARTLEASGKPRSKEAAASNDKWTEEAIARVREAIDSAIKPLREEVKHWRSHYEAAQANWNECLKRMKEAESANRALVEALKRR